MARKRMVSPEFFTSRPLNLLPVQTMVTFAGLWCYVDDMGRGEDDTVMIKAAIWARRRGVTEARVETDLAALDQSMLVCRYGVAGYALLHVINWSEHQKINHPTESKLPPCHHHEPAAWEVFLNDPDPKLEKYRRVPGALREESLAIEVSSREENLSDSESRCSHGVLKDSGTCAMCERRQRRAS